MARQRIVRMALPQFFSGERSTSGDWRLQPVGWVERGETHRCRCPLPLGFVDDELSAQFCPGRKLLLYRKSLDWAGDVRDNVTEAVSVKSDRFRCALPILRAIELINDFRLLGVLR